LELISHATLQTTAPINEDINKKKPTTVITDNNLSTSTINEKPKFPVNYYSNTKNAADNEFSNRLSIHNTTNANRSDKNEYAIKPLTPTPNKTTNINTNIIYSPNV
jgi:hypothetical protein